MKAMAAAIPGWTDSVCCAAVRPVAFTVMLTEPTALAEKKKSALLAPMGTVVMVTGVVQPGSE